MIKLNFKNDRSWFILLLTLCLFLWLISLGNVPLRDWDEGYYATVAQDMFQSGNWIYLTYADQPFLLKPPLIIWLINISYNLWGISEFTTRFPCSLLTALGVPLLYLIGKNLFYKPTPAIFSSLVYLTLLPVVRHGRLAMIDGIINTFLLFSILCLLKSKKHPIWGIGFCIGLGLIALSKGILVLALGGILGIYILLDDPKILLKNYYLWIGLLIGFFPVVSWYYLQINHYGEQFIQIHFLQQNFDRLSTAVEGNSGSPWYYILELVKYSLPWLIFFPNGLILAVKNYKTSWAKLVLTGFLIFLAIITIMGTKLPWYIMPIYPFFALAIGYYLSDLYSPENNYPKTLFFSLFFLGSLTILGGIYLFIETHELFLVIMSCILSMTLFLTAQKMKQNSTDFVIILIIGLYTSLTLFMISNTWVWELNEAFAVKPVATLIKNNTPLNTIIYTSFAYSRPSLDFYSDRQILAEDNNRLRQLSTTSAYLLLDNETLDTFQLTNVKILGEVGEFVLISTNNQQSK
ncbi:MAG: glycosyltransferase family 39 protein [Crocosphaera sp.]|nr:glycosyltransferase family 39 protein [Crocosphaera sp.]